jgi:serine/threonine protein kinase
MIYNQPQRFQTLVPPPNQDARGLPWMGEVAGHVQTLVNHPKAVAGKEAQVQGLKLTVKQEMRRAADALLAFCRKFDQIPNKTMEMVAAFNQALKPLFAATSSQQQSRAPAPYLDAAALAQIRDTANRACRAAMAEPAGPTQAGLPAEDRARFIRGLTMMQLTAIDPQVRREVAAKLQALHAEPAPAVAQPAKARPAGARPTAPKPQGPRAMAVLAEQNRARNQAYNGAPLARQGHARARRNDQNVAPAALPQDPAVTQVQGQLQKLSFTLPKNIKSKWPAADYASLGLSNKYSKLLDATGTAYVMTPTINRGSFGKVRLAVAPDGNTYAVKELRHQAKAGRDKNGRAKTHASSRRDVEQEFALTTHLRDHIEAQMQTASAMAPNGQQSLQRVRSGTTPFKLHAMVYDAGRNKSYYVMNRDSGDIGQLSGTLTRPQRQAAAMSLAIQGFAELGALHSTTGYAHLDLSMGNIFYTPSGQMKIMDFGVARKMDAGGRVDARSFAFTLNGPEHLELMRSRLPQRKLAASCDTFAMAALVVGMAAGPRVRNPFANNFVLPGTENLPRDQQLDRLFKTFDGWKKMNRDPVTKLISPARMAAQPPSPFSDFFIRLAESDANLCTYLVDHVMTTSVNDRPSAAAVARIILTAAQTFNADFEGLKKTMALVDETPQIKQVLSEARTYNLWENRHAAGVAQQRRTHPRGQPRPLPPLRA